MLLSHLGLPGVWPSRLGVVSYLELVGNPSVCAELTTRPGLMFRGCPWSSKLVQFYVKCACAGMYVLWKRNCASFSKTLPYCLSKFSWEEES